MAMIWESQRGGAASPPELLTDGPPLTAEPIGGLMVLRVLSMNTEEAGKLGVQARTHTQLDPT